jgi:predicted secreted protein
MRAVVWMRGAGALALAVSMLLGACAGGDKTPPVVAKPLVKSAGKSVTVTIEQSGAAVELGLDQELIVRLATAVTSGHQWALIDPAPGVLVAVGPAFERDLRNNTLDEVTGTSVWSLKPVAAGTVALRFELRRPRKVEPAKDVVTYNVKVQ